VGLFGRRSRRDEREPELVEDELHDDDYGDFEDHVEGSLVSEFGPYDEADAPDDDLARLDLGSVQIPVPDGAQLQVEMDEADPRVVKSVHVMTPVGRVTLNAYAAPRNGDLWQEVCGDLAAQLRGDGATVRSEVGDWGQELVASLGEVMLRFIGYDGDRWMLRGVVASPPELTRQGSEVLRDMMRGTVVVRGSQPMPVSTPLPIDLPEAIAAHIAQVQAQGGPA
jgi:hypothetical protein